MYVNTLKIGVLKLSIYLASQPIVAVFFYNEHYDFTACLLGVLSPTT